MDNTARRRRKILEIIEGHQIDSQEGLKAKLSEHSIHISQPTLSRDIKALNLVKIPSTNGGYRYGRHEVPGDRMDLTGICASFVRRTDCSGNLVVLRTEPGTASVVGRSLDDSNWDEIVGTIAGTDTVFVVVREGSSAKQLVDKIANLTSERA